MPHTLTSHVYKCFQLDEKQDSYKCIESKKNGEACDTTIKIGKWNPCSNLKRHIERCHSEAWKRIKLAEEQDSSSRVKKRQLALASQSTITRGGVEDTRLEAKAKDTKKIRGQGQGQPFRGQTLSRPRTGMLEAKAKDQGHKAQVLSKKKKKRSSQKFFRRSPKKKKKKKKRSFSSDLH